MSKRRQSMVERHSMAEREDGTAINVVCRFRPPRTAAHHGGSEGVLDNFSLEYENNTVECVAEGFDRRLFEFNKVLNIDTEQSTIFNEVAGVVDSVMKGFNGTVMAYGQTSSGKTHTMEGPNLFDAEMRGVIPRAIEKLFNCIYDSDETIEFTLAVSYFEIYCEKIRDLLNPDSCDLKIRESKIDGYHITDLTEVFCGDEDSIFNIISSGKANRATSSTLMNAESSRSHSILSIRVEQKHTDGATAGRLLKGKLFMVDLAGSEKVSKTGAKGARLEEAKNINRSLTSLGMVIQALSDRNSHIPYRDSKLTRVLEQSLGGNSKTTLIVCCAAENRHVSETLSTLRFAERAATIKNKATVNEELSVAELTHLLKQARKEIAILKRQLTDAGIEPLNPASASASALTVNSIEQSAAAIGTTLKRLDVVSEEASEDEEYGNDATLDFPASPATSTDVDAESTPLGTSIENSSATASVELMKTEIAQTVDVGITTSPTKNSGVSREELEELQIEIEKWQTAHENIQKELADARNESLTLEEELTLSKGECQELERHMQELHNTTDENEQKNKELTAEVAALHSSITELQNKVVEATMKAKETEEYNKKLMETNEESKHTSRQKDEMAAERLALAQAQIESTKEEAQAAEQKASALVAQAEEIKAKSKLNNIPPNEDPEVYVERLMQKLHQEQGARAELEDQLDAAMQEIWKNEKESSNGGSFFKKMFQGGGGTMGLSSKEKDLQKRVEHLNIRLSQQLASHEASREANRIVLETKESVVKSLLRQNAQLTGERDALSTRVEDLSASVEQLTTLLRTVQSRRSSLGGNGGAGAGADSATGNTRRPSMTRGIGMERRPSLRGGQGQGRVERRKSETEQSS